MEKSYDLIAFDMDGTLLDSNKQLRRDSIEAIDKAASLGKTVIIATGRSIPELQDYIPALPGIRYIVSASGAYIYDTFRKKKLFETIIPLEVCIEMFRRIEGRDLLLQLLGNKCYMQGNKIPHSAYYQMAPYQNLFEQTSTKVDDIDSFYLETPVPLYKFNLYPHTAQEREELRALFADLPLTMVNHAVTALECSALGISKGNTAAALCKMLGIPESHMICVGDSENDLSLFEKAGLSVAMGNAESPIKEIADVIVAGNDEGGCAKAIYKYLLGE